MRLVLGQELMAPDCTSIHIRWRLKEKFKIDERSFRLGHHVLYDHCVLRGGNSVVEQEGILRAHACNR